MMREKGFKRRYVLCGAGVFVGVCVLFVYVTHKKNASDFLSDLQKYEVTKAGLVQAWPMLASKAKTSMQYLMLLKRLHVYGLSTPYEKVLIRALWKHKGVSSIVALGVDYFLQQYSIEKNRIVTTNAHSSVVHKELKKFLDGAVDVLWERYPHMVRLYYITNMASHGSAMRESFTNDALLRLYKQLHHEQASWQDYRELWQLTKEDAFLYLLIAHAQRAGEASVATNAYKAFLQGFMPSHAPQHSAIISYVALLMQDIATLLGIAERRRSEDALLNVASAYIDMDRRNEAWELLEKYNETIPRLSETWDFVYFWLASRSGELSYGEMTRLYQRVSAKYSKVMLPFAYEYFVYCYKKHREYDENACDGEKSLFPNEFWAEPRVAFLEREKEQVHSIQPSRTALWSAYNAHGDSPLWWRVLASYALKNALYDDFALLQQQHVGNEAMLPYEFFFATQRNDKKTIERLINKVASPSFIQESASTKTMSDNAGHEFPWWHYYNVAVQYNGTGEYENAQKALQKAEALYRRSYHYDEYPYMPYIWIQYAYAAKGNNDMETAAVFLNKIRDVEPTFVYLQKFED